MAAISFDNRAWDSTEPWIRPAPDRCPPLRLVTAPPARRGPDLVVYRRRRLVVAVLAAALLFAAGLGVARIGAASGSAGSAPVTPVVLVAQPGDSYWTLADRIHNGGDLRSTVDALVAANGGRGLRPGDRITLAR